MSFTYSTKELTELEKMLELKLFSLKVAQANKSLTDDQTFEMNLTTNILKFVQYLVNRELTNMGFWRSPAMSDPTFSGYGYGYGSYPNTVPSAVPSMPSVSIDSATICENCRMKNPSNTHCVHKVKCGDAQDYGDCDCGNTIEQIKAIKVEPPEK